MPGKIVTLAVVIAFVASACAGSGGEEQSAEGAPPMPPDMADMTPQVVLETSMGQIVMELDAQKAPRTVDNIVDHVQSGFYDGLTFHRVIPGFMIQGGGFTPDMRQRDSSRPQLTNEADNQLKNLRGTVAMARTPAPHSAKTQFFINLVDNSNLDHRDKTDRGWGYAVFGRVIEGMEVVDSIAQVPTHTVGQYADVPAEPVLIQRAYIRTEGE